MADQKKTARKSRAKKVLTVEILKPVAWLGLSYRVGQVIKDPKMDKKQLQEAKAFGCIKEVE